MSWPPTVRVADSAHLGWGMRMCISTKLPDDADAFQELYFENFCLKYFLNLGL